MPEPLEDIPMNTRRNNPGSSCRFIFLAGWLAGLGLLLSLPQVFADEADPSPISAETTVSQREITIGDIVTYSIIVTHDPGIHVAPPDPTPHFRKGFEFVDQGTSESQSADGRREITFGFKFRADAVGFYNFPEIPVEFTAPAPGDPSQTLPGILKAPKAEIVIRSVLFIDEEAEDIKDIKPIIGAGLDWQKYLHWILTGLALLLAVFGFYKWTRPRKKVPAPVSAPDLKLHDIAMAELDQLLAKKLLDSGRFREHYFELSEIFRRYLGALLSIPALDWTTEEIRDYLSGRGAKDPGLRRTILALLPATDRVKFAKAPVELQTALNHVATVRRFIRETTPTGEAPVPT